MVLTIEDNETRYDIKMPNHGHFKCELCGKIFDFAVNIDNFMTDELI
jgi:Ferric uptake regulator family.